MKQATSRMLFAYWDEMRGERTSPERAQMDANRMRHLLADMFLLAVEPGQATRFRSAGTRCSALFGRDLAGTTFASLWGEGSNLHVDHLIEVVVSERSGVVAGLSGETATGGRVPLELLLLPLRQDGATHARVIGSIAPDCSLVPVAGDPVGRLRTRTMRVIRSSDRRDVDAPDRPAAPARPARFTVIQGGRAS